MKKISTYLIALTLISASMDATAVELPDFVTLAKRYGPSVVNISTRQTQSIAGGFGGFDLPNMPDNAPLREFIQRFLGDPEDLPEEALRSRSLGSGFFVSADGYILTNYHVVKDADEVIVRTSDRREFEAKIIGSDLRSDTALIKVEITNAPVVTVGNTKDLEVGAWVLAIGSPFGFEQSVTQGIVSALGRSLPSENYVPFIQTDVAINPGNSGGPLIDLQGRVVGINSQIYSRTGGFMGLSFAIPIELAMNVVEQLKTKGHVTRGWLGVMIQDVTRDLAETFAMKNPSGALVVQVLKDSPSDIAGIKIGDIILEYNGHEIPTSASLPPLVGTSPIDRPSKMLVLRDGKKLNINITIGELPEDEALPKLGKASKDTLPPNRLGLAVRDLNKSERKDLNLAVGEGVMIERVTRGAAKTAGLKSGDVILMFNGSMITKGATQLHEEMDTLPKNRTVAILVQRGNDRLFIPLQLP
jgi:serine protease Do